MCREDDRQWPQPDKVGKQELEILLGNEHIAFTVNFQRIKRDIDFKVRFFQRCEKQQRSRGTHSVLLLAARFEVPCILYH